MSTLARGLASVLPPSRTSVGGFVVTDAVIDSMLQKTQASFRAVERSYDLVRSKLPAGVLASWDSFYAGWREFYAANLGVGSLLGNGVRADMIDKYNEDLKSYIDALNKASPGSYTGPTPGIDPDSKKDQMDLLKTGLYTAIALATVVVVSQVVKR